MMLRLYKSSVKSRVYGEFITFSSSLRHCSQASISRGLFGHKELKCPDDWTKVATRAVQEYDRHNSNRLHAQSVCNTIINHLFTRKQALYIDRFRCKSLVDDIAHRAPGRGTLHVLDEISDKVCHATDAAAFCAAAHADKTWRAAARHSHNVLQNFIAELNTSQVLWTALKSTMNQANSLSQSQRNQVGWTVEEIKVGNSLLQEFRQAGMDLNQQVQEDYRHLCAEELRISSFLNQYETRRQGDSAVMQIPRSLYDKYHFQRAAPSASLSCSSSSQHAPVDVVANVPMQRWLTMQGHSSEARRAAYQALHSLPEEVHQSLIQLSQTRHSIAKLVESPSYMHYKLQSAGLMQQPERVSAFLESVKERLSKNALVEYTELEKFARDTKLIDAGFVFGSWDKGLAQARMLQHNLQKAGLSEAEPAFTVKSTLNSLFQVVEQLFNVKFHQQPLHSSESWAPDLLKLHAVSEDRGFLGTVFLDLYQRSQKYTTSAHFTLCCGKRVSSRQYRHPIVALSCNFSSSDAMISFCEVKTLFHEFGHAMNSVLCDNSMQHLFGARGPLDVVELPSHILERAAVQESVLRSLVAASHNDGENTLRIVMLRERTCESLSRLEAFVLPRADALLHGKSPPRSAIELQHRYNEEVMNALPYSSPVGTFPFLSINHAVSYAGLCHSYVLADLVSVDIWSAAGALTKLRDGNRGNLAEVLYRPGGAVNASEVLQTLLSNEACGSLKAIVINDKLKLAAYQGQERG